MYLYVIITQVYLYVYVSCLYLDNTYHVFILPIAPVILFYKFTYEFIFLWIFIMAVLKHFL